MRVARENRKVVVFMWSLQMQVPIKWKVNRVDILSEKLIAYKFNFHSTKLWTIHLFCTAVLALAINNLYVDLISAPPRSQIPWSRNLIDPLGQRCLVAKWGGGLSSALLLRPRHKHIHEALLSIFPMTPGFQVQGTWLNLGGNKTRTSQYSVSYQ